MYEGDNVFGIGGLHEHDLPGYVRWQMTVDGVRSPEEKEYWARINKDYNRKYYFFFQRILNAIGNKEFHAYEVSNSEWWKLEHARQRYGRRAGILK